MDYKTPLPPFKWFILENFPYIEEDFDALTNWQLFCKLGKEMNKIIEKVNLTGEQVEELTNAFNTLKNYVDTYFENLDLQEEVDTKLDEMAQSGELAELISQYLEAQAIIGFNTNSSLASATNLANGSFARTYGKESYNDGKGAFYKIRTRINTDVPDGDNIIVLTNTENLVAEKMPDYRMNQAESSISTIQSDIANINQKLTKKYIFIGDSYNTTDTPAGGVPIVPWSSKLKDYLGLTNNDYYNSGVSGAGWTNGTTFQQQLETLGELIDNKNTITDIIVAGGINDLNHSQSDIFTAIVLFCNYVATNYPNAMITWFPISWTKSNTQRNFLRNLYQNTNNLAIRKNFRSDENANTYYHQYQLYQPDGHPNQAGSETIAYFMANFLKGGACNVRWNDSGYIYSAGNTLGITAENIGTYEEFFSNGLENIKLTFSNTIATNVNVSYDGSRYTLGTISLKSGYFQNLYALGTIGGWFYANNQYKVFTGRLEITESGTITVIFDYNGETINSARVLHFTNAILYSIPAEYC